MKNKQWHVAVKYFLSIFIFIFLFFCQYFGLINISYMINSVWVYAQTHRNIQHKHPNNGVLTKQIRLDSNDERNMFGYAFIVWKRVALTSCEITAFVFQ